MKEVYDHWLNVMFAEKVLSLVSKSAILIDAQTGLGSLMSERFVQLLTVRRKQFLSARAACVPTRYSVPSKNRLYTFFPFNHKEGVLKPSWLFGYPLLFLFGDSSKAAAPNNPPKLLGRSFVRMVEILTFCDKLYSAKERGA